MDGPLKELAKLEKLTAGGSGKGKSPSIADSLDSLLYSLREARDAIQPGTVSPDFLLQLSQTVDLKKKEVDDRQKEIYNSVSRLGKALDKKFPVALPSYPDVFTSPTSVTALERTIALHFLRTGQFDTAGIFLQEAGLDIPAELRAQFIDLHRILQALRGQDINPALGWVAKNRSFLRERASPLEFHLHRSQYIRLLLSNHPPNALPAIEYAKGTMAPFYAENADEFKRLIACIAYLPLSKLQTSPYADLASPSLHFDLEPLFAKEYCASLGMSRQVPLRVVGDIGGGGALARIEKGRKVMRERKSEWSQADELPIEIPLPPENRYHSIFACPVSKEQSSEMNPPMMMGCGHVVTKDSLHKLSKPGGIVARAGPSATTFPAVFTAYNAVLKERGIDSSEVLFYGKLLKLGTLKGSSWGEKWNMVKLQQGYGGMATRNDASKSSRSAPARIPRVELPRTRHHDAESLTLHSHENEDSKIGSDDEEQAGFDVPQYHLLNRRLAARRPASPVDSDGTSPSLDSRNYPLLAPPIHRSRPGPPPGPRIWDDDISDATEHAAPSTTPPSYRAAVNQLAPVKLQISTPARSTITRPSSASLAAARRLIAQARERKGSVANEDDAWKKIKMIQDEKHADRFREDRLLERCWEVWKQGFQWIVTTNEQIGEARDHLILRLCIHRWRTRTVASQERIGRVTNVANRRHLEVAFGAWKTKTREREQARWRDSMRAKMKLIRDRRELKLMKDVLERWKQCYKTRVAVQHYTDALTARYYRRWRRRLAHLDHLDDVADGLSQVVEGGVLERCWYRWKHESQLQVAYKIVSDNVGLRVKTEVMDAWRRQMRENHIADAYYDIVLKKGVLRSWKAARDRKRAMENRATRHIVLRDRLQLRAWYMVWRTRYQGRQLESITDMRRMKEAWAVWITRLRQRRDLENVALAFSLRLNSPLAVASLKKWRQVNSSHKNSQSFAVFHYSDCLRRKTLLAWRITLRRNHEMTRKARAVDKFFVTRSAWGILRAKFAERKRQRNLKTLELRKTQNIFYAWFERAHRQRAQRLAEEKIRNQIVKRILTIALTKWTNRTIEVKNRELQATIDRDAWLTSIAFKKWKGARSRHVEEVSLMESYQFVKREENIRKIFHRWLSAARATRHRRLTLERKETEIRSDLISVAWDKWRERFKHKRLQPINALFRAFRIWHSKTKSLPAIRFNASRIKVRCWNIWLEALPRALQNKTAREVEKKAVLSKFLDKWLQAHRTKVALKAVA
ncbi:CTLH/CRA C-terminal to lish motif domain-containing protein [Mycena galericulata]|nr:CTLH/CRA C-terminal to lish motif domain-containing protein [Mycena galericulata]